MYSGADNLLAVDIVLANGRHVRAQAEGKYSDLFKVRSHLVCDQEHVMCAQTPLNASSALVDKNPNISSAFGNKYHFNILYVPNKMASQVWTGACRRRAEWL